MSAGFVFGAPASAPASTGATTTTAGSSGSLFGNSTAPSGHLFGSGSTGLSFGNTGNSSLGNGGDQKSLFGALSNTTGTTGTTTNTTTPASSSTGFSFTPAPTSGASSGNPFASPKPTPSSQSALTSSTPAPTTSAPKFSFANPSTTPAGPPPAASTFAASTGGSSTSLFGAVSKSTDNKSSTSGFNFGTTPSSQAPAGGASAFSFGQKPADKPAGTPFAFPSPASTNATGGGGGLFGTASASGTDASKPSLFTGFSSAQPAQSKSNATTTTTNIFGAQSSTAKSSQPALTQANTTNIFGAQASTTQSSQPTSTQATTPSLFAPSSQPASTQAPSSNLFNAPSSTTATSSDPKPAFSLPSTTSQPASSAPATTSAAPTPLFGGLTATSTTADSSAAPKSLFGGPTTTTATSGTAAATTTAPAASSAPALTGFGKSTATTAAPTSADLKGVASTAGPPPPPQSRLKNKTMDEILTRWATDLTKYTKEFKNQADTIAKWDQTIVDNSAKIDKLYVKTRTCERQTMSVEMQLSAVENQQSELDAWLTKYENEVEEMQAKDNANPAELGGPDQERERTYKLAEKLQERLDDMGRDLETMVEEVNAANASLHKNGKADEPITQIVRILNTHLSQLRAIDQGTAALQKKMADAQKTAHGLAYLPGAKSEARAAVDDFYRSYIGRQ